MFKIINYFVAIVLIVCANTPLTYSMSNDEPFIPVGQPPLVSRPPLGRTDGSQEQASSSSSSSSSSGNFPVSQSVRYDVPANGAQINISRAPGPNALSGEREIFQQEVANGNLVHLEGDVFISVGSRTTAENIRWLRIWGDGRRLTGPQMEQLSHVIAQNYPNLESIEFARNVLGNEAFEAFAKNALASRLKRLSFTGPFNINTRAFNQENLDRFKALESLTVNSIDFGDAQFIALANSRLTTRLENLSIIGTISSNSFNAQNLAKFKALKKLTIKSDKLNNVTARDLDSLIEQLISSGLCAQLQDLAIVGEGAPLRTSERLKQICLLARINRA